MLIVTQTAALGVLVTVVLLFIGIIKLSCNIKDLEIRIHFLEHFEAKNCTNCTDNNTNCTCSTNDLPLKLK